MKKKNKIFKKNLDFDIRNQDSLLSILLLDRTKSAEAGHQNIVWANDYYIEHGIEAYAPSAPILPELITGANRSLIIPRALKTIGLQKERTKTNAEVFTPPWIVQKQNDAIDADFQADDRETYVRRKWLEITCGEAPYMTTRYNMETGAHVPIPERHGFVDRKLARINAEVTDKAEWQRFAELAYQASYGFEWNGDSLLLARENLLATYYDFFLNTWNAPPAQLLLETIATIISFNVFQMDGLTGTLPPARYKNKPDPEPMTCAPKEKAVQMILPGTEEPSPLITGLKAKIMNWDFLTMEPFLPGEAAP
jgi:hypothetical protein